METDTLLIVGILGCVLAMIYNNIQMMKANREFINALQEYVKCLDELEKKT